MLPCVSHRASQGVHLIQFLRPLVSNHRHSSTGSRTRETRQLWSDKVASPTLLHATEPANLHQHSRKVNGLDSAVPDADVTFFNESVLRLRYALETRDIERVWECWSQLRERKLLNLLGPQLWGYSVQLAKLCPRSLEAAGAHKLKTIETIALHSAGRGAVVALVACMVTHLRAGDSRSVLDLYTKYLHELRASWTDPPPSGALPVPQGEEDDLEELSAGSSAETSSHIVVHNSVLLAVITAHALDNAFHAALDAFLQFPRKIPQRVVKEVLSQLHDVSLRSKVENYVNRLHTARYLSDPRQLTLRTSLLASNLDDAGLEKLYNTIIDGLGGEEAYIAVRPAELTKQRPVALEEINWAAFLTAFLKCNRRDLGISLWNDMLKFGIKPTAVSWTALLDGYGSMKATEDAEKAWDIMITQGTEPSAMTYRAIVSTFFNARKPANAVKYFGLFQQRLAEGWTPDAEDCLAVYNTVLHGLLINGREGDAHALLQRLREKGPKPDIVSFNTLLRHHSRRGEFRHVSRILDQISEDGLTGDVYTFSMVLSSLLKLGRTDATNLILNLMRKQNIEPNTAIFSAIIDHQVREATEEGLRAGMELLQKMEQSQEAQPNDVTYTGILAGLHRQNWVNAAFARECKQHILGQMKKRGIQFNRTVYHILLKACLENPAPEGLEEALGYYREMAKRKVALSYDTWYVLLRGMISREAWAVADEMVRDLKRHMTPHGSLESLVTRIRKRMAWRNRLGPNVYF
ncbi:hypothetical protein ID866_9167 [Astraeus odoratus]|nr:hypothetical protein ID866_9167 [Astraeus odoratus]